MKDRLAVLNEIESTGVVAVVRADSSEQLGGVVGALYEGGLTCIEITMTTPNALEAIAEAAKEYGDRCAIGVGTVLDAETARAAILAGAVFVVAPILDLPTVELCKRYSKVVVPGAFTPTEIVRAWQAGADVVKVFPATKLGPSFFKDMKGPLPHIKLTPTGGVSLENAGEFIKAGAVALGVGSAMVDKKAVASGDFKTLTSKAAAFIKAVADARA
ncbi:MAG TPA: bifunctional 4-hydroxy-2-oxoglutarate aldolase/2-dehydro-3-deoxy-phosphogluconate aldolase [Phycisphaerae bacterium]|nr:bifunctional 4-hydroxy-2-oxoglutarate aldolase/2-dehydro-3-deoxy-phosphogluconate aldolase [Phycisphaerae bacterium]